MTTSPTRTLETFPNPQPDRDYIIEIRTPEFTCLCPKTGQPDFATLYLEYVPDQLCVELKSYKLYIWSFRNEGHFHEKVTNAILSDLVAATQPRYMRLRAEFNVRGGVYTTVTAEHRQPGFRQPPAMPDDLPRTEQDATQVAVVTVAPVAAAPMPVTPAAPEPVLRATADTRKPFMPLNLEVSEVSFPEATAAAPDNSPTSPSDRLRMLARRRPNSPPAEPTVAVTPPSAKPTAPPVPPKPVARPEPPRDIYIGIDLGTSGCRAVALNAKQRVLARTEATLPAALRQGKQVTQDPNDWWKAVSGCLKELVGQVDAKRVHRIAVAGSTGTILFTDKNGQPQSPGLMANDRRAEDEAERIAAIADDTSAAFGTSGSLAKLLWLQATKVHARAAHVLHAADWISNRLTGSYGHSDYHNCLTLGYDPQKLAWPKWLDELDVNRALLPKVHAPGETIGRISADTAKALGLLTDTEVTAGTTDTVAAFLATGVFEPGHGVTILGNNLTLQMISPKPIFANRYGVYSHRLGQRWLTGGTSNSGGAILLQYFTVEHLREMATLLEPEHPTDLNYYPLPATGERFPVNDPRLEPRLEPLPGDSTVFLQGLLEGIARIESQGYARLAELGAPKLKALWTIGGGSQNSAWTRLREHIVGVKPKSARFQHTACGAALLAAGVVQETFV
ncbi:MAG: NADPH-dependent 7-cyano-7-deazaguanine reductase QueF [Gammaproteobacteria bacterium]|nr:NADPH-dependent 7-cyano-7-deazaguanine reductase QueF [Gammaproteobacteria bacterium]